MKKLFSKTFLHCLCLIMGVVLISFFLIYSFLPTVYRKYKQNEIISEVQKTATALENSSEEKIIEVLASCPLQNGYGYTAKTEDGEVICSAGAGMSISVIGDASADIDETVSFDFDYAEGNAIFHNKEGQIVNLTMSISLQPIGDAVLVLLYLLPLILPFCILLAVVVSYFYARSITKPIQRITNATIQMSQLLPTASCSVVRSDEIGVLSANIDEMYKRLLDTISGLEQKIEAVNKAEQEKLDFLLLASHELKTPLTAVRGMVDGMIYQVGIYKDRDTYLTECQNVLENLSELLCRILETSKIDAGTEAKNIVQTDIGKLVKEVAEPYFLIAQSRDVAMTISIQQNIIANISPELIKKAISNVISNGVKYTESGKSIHIIMKNRQVIIENECEPLTDEEVLHITEPFYRPASQSNSDSTGLGLYFTDRLLSVCEIAYSFCPYEQGMRFIMNF